MTIPEIPALCAEWWWDETDRHDDVEDYEWWWDETDRHDDVEDYEWVEEQYPHDSLDDLLSELAEALTREVRLNVDAAIEVMAATQVVRERVAERDRRQSVSPAVIDRRVAQRRVAR